MLCSCVFCQSETCCCDCDVAGHVSLMRDSAPVKPHLFVLSASTAHSEHLKPHREQHTSHSHWAQWPAQFHSVCLHTQCSITVSSKIWHKLQFTEHWRNNISIFFFFVNQRFSLGFYLFYFFGHCHGWLIEFNCLCWVDVCNCISFRK